MLIVFIQEIKNSFYLAIDKSNKIRQKIYSYNKDDDIYLNNIKKVTSYIEIFRIPGQIEPIVGWGYSELEPRPLPHYGDVVVSEIKRITKKYGKCDKMILLLDCSRPLDKYDQELVLTQIRNFSFNGEVWVIENFTNEEKAIRLL